MNKKVAFLAVVAVAVAAVGIALFSGDQAAGVDYRLAKVERGAVVKMVSASGALSPVVTVEVGSQVSGRILELAADFNSEVRAGQVIARIDAQSFAAKVRQAKAELGVARAQVATKRAAVVRAQADFANAKANLAAAQADVAKARVAIADAKLDFDRKAELRQRGVVAVSSVDKARAAYETALAQLASAKAGRDAKRSTRAARKAQVAMSEAEVVQAQAQVEQRRAGLSFAETDFNNTFIRSPVDGVVIRRSVDVGQTVAASLQAPTLFTIAQDLRKMQVETNIDEADIGQVRTGQRAKFTVDSFPEREFSGTVEQVRKAPQTVSNVVTYIVVVDADNPELRLLPGMTANVNILVSERANVLRVPDKALRFRPPGHTAGAAPAAPGPSSAGFQQHGPGGPPSGANAQQRGQRGQRLRRLASQLDLDDGQKAQLGELFRDLRAQVIGLRQGGLRGDEFRATVRQLRRQQNGRIMALLKPGQQTKFRALIAGRAANPVTRARVWVLKDGAPAPVTVFIGVGDGTFTEIVRGDLQEGDEIITGAGRTAGGEHRSRFRFGL